MRQYNVKPDADNDFAGWYAVHWPKVLRSVAVTVGDHELAEEAVAEAFARALARWPATAELDSPTAWLHRVAVNEIRSRWRRRRTERRMLERLATESTRSASGPEPRNDALWAAVAALPERARHMVALRYVLDMHEAEIAAELGITRGTVASTLCKARQSLSVELAPAKAGEEL